MEADSVPKISICLKDQSGEKMYCRLRVNVKLIKLVRLFCREKHLDYANTTVYFLRDGVRLRREGTVHQAGLKNGDHVDVLVNVNGETSMEAHDSLQKIRLCIKDQNGDRMYVKIRYNVEVIFLLRKYCKVKELDYRRVGFVHDIGNGTPLRRGTIRQVGLKDFDEIQALIFR